MTLDKNTERSKENIIADLKSIRRAHRSLESIWLLIDHLEHKDHHGSEKDRDLFEEEFHLQNKHSDTYKTDRQRYKAFCHTYLKVLFEKFIGDPDDLELMLAIYRYHPKYSHIKNLANIRYQFACNTYEDKHPEIKWGATEEEKSRGMFDVEERIINDLAGTLEEFAAKNNGELGLAKDVLAIIDSPINSNDDKSIKQPSHDFVIEEFSILQRGGLQTPEADNQETSQDEFVDDNPADSPGIPAAKQPSTPQSMKEGDSEQYDGENRCLFLAGRDAIFKSLMRPINPLPLYAIIIIEFLVIFFLIHLLSLQVQSPVRRDYTDNYNVSIYNETIYNSVD